jgi:hypothetical protein
MLVEPDHPVPQRLPVHPADPRRFRARGAIHDRCKRQRACATSFVRVASRRNSVAVKSGRNAIAWPMANLLSLPS